MIVAYKDALKKYEEEPLTKHIVLDLLKGYKRPYDKIDELVRKGELIQLKRGLYIPGPNSDLAKPETLLIANHLWGPSYVSMETALSYWGLIPERVYEISSITTRSTKKYKTPIGRFSYLHAPLPYYSFGITNVELTKKQVALIATREKALCDKIIMTSGIFLRSTKGTKEFLLDDLRIEKEQLRSLDLTKIQSWLISAPKQSSLQMLIKTLKEL